jgi:trigger factor
MTDETRPDEPGTETAATQPETTTAVATPETETASEAKPGKLHQQVFILDIGPCKKHIKVTVDRSDIDARFREKFDELIRGDKDKQVMPAMVAGFRPGKAPRKIIEKRFQKEVGDQVKTEVLLASLEQLAEDHDIAPLSAPNIDPSRIELPHEGPLTYEFEVEVRPQFDLPSYKGLKIRRPVHTFTDDEVVQEERRILAPYGQVIPKPAGDAQLGDILVADVTVRDGERMIGSMKETSFTVNKQLAFKDGLANKFAEQVRGAKAGDKRQVDIKLSSAAADATLRGKSVQATFEIKDVKTLRLPELTHEFLHTFSVHTPDQLRELIRVVLERRLAHTQRQSAREQVIAQIAATSSWQLPEEMLARQARKALARRVMEMRADGISEQEIAAKTRLMQQDILQSTALALKEHFVLQKIAEVEKIDVNDDDLEDEIERIAAQNDESPRRVRAKLEKDDLLDALAAEMIERKALDLILDNAVYEDYPLGEEEKTPDLGTSEEQAVPGEMHDPSAVPPLPAEATPSTPPSEPPPSS